MSVNHIVKHLGWDKYVVASFFGKKWSTTSSCLPNLKEVFTLLHHTSCLPSQADQPVLSIHWLSAFYLAFWTLQGQLWSNTSPFLQLWLFSPSFVILGHSGQGLFVYSLRLLKKGILLLCTSWSINWRGIRMNFMSRDFPNRGDIHNTLPVWHPLTRSPGARKEAREAITWRMSPSTTGPMWWDIEAYAGQALCQGLWHRWVRETIMLKSHSCSTEYLLMFRV